MTKYLFLISAFFFCTQASAQQSKADSLIARLAVEKKDSNKVTLLWNLADSYNNFKPDTALIIAQNALQLAKEIKFKEGESRSMGILANSFLLIGNYPKALEYYLLKLKLEEKRNNPRNMASVIMNIGIIYSAQEEYIKALTYYYKADSLIEKNNVNDFKYNIALNLGDLYFSLRITDSAYKYFNKSLIIAVKKQDGNHTGISMIGLGHVFLQRKNYDKARDNYKGSLPYLKASNNEGGQCESLLGLAELYGQLNKNDSAKYYAMTALSIAKKDGFLPWHLKAADFLNIHYKKIKNIDSAYVYLQISQRLHDSLSSKERIRESQNITINEQLRQNEITEQKRLNKIERDQQLQLLFIGIFIPALFLMTLLLSRRKLHIRVIKFLGIISLLILFEYLTLLLHPYVAHLTDHTPIYELLIFVCIAAILIRAHHRIEDWFVNKLIHRNQKLSEKSFTPRRFKLRIKKPS